MTKLDLNQIPKSKTSLHMQYLAAQAILERHLSSPQDPSSSLLLGPMEDYERPNPNQPLPDWNLWGDAGIVTRKNPTDPYPKNWF